MGAVTPAGAGAAESKIYVPASTFKVEGTNGYTVFVQYGREGMVLAAIRDRKRAYYFGSATTSADGRRLDAKFGNVAEIHVTFHRERVGRFVLSRCHGEREYGRTEYGTFTGTIVFRGENGFTKVDATSARAVPPTATCSSSGATSPGSGLQVDVERRAGNLRTSFRARKNHRGTSVFFEARITEFRNGFTVQRMVERWAGTSSLTYDRPLTKAVIRTTGPFAGTAVLRRRAGGSTTLRGTLRASFPGKPGVALTGPEQRVRYMSGDFYQRG
jgi:hypothetical protein